MAGKGPSERDLDDPDAFRSVWAIRDAIHTRVHAEMLFDLVENHLGDAAWVETYNAGTRRVLFRREAPGADTFIPWPLVSLSTKGRHGAVVMVAAPEGAPLEPPPRPGRVPKLRNLGPGEVVIHDGPQSATITYGDDGRWKEVTRGGPKDTLWGVIAALAKKSANPVELVAEFIAGLDVAQHGPGRVHLPVRLPGGVQGVWNCGLFALREALFDGRVPGNARWAAADGCVGKAIAWGGSPEEAMAAWRTEVERTRPFPPEPETPPTPPPEESARTTSDPAAGTFGVSMTLRGPSSDVAMPEPSVANTPAVLIELGPPPDYDPPIGVWTRLLGRHGTTIHGALRRDENGFTLLGDRLAAVIESEDLEDLRRRLTVADIDHDSRPMPTFERPPGFPEPPTPTSTVRTYSVVDEDTGAPTAVTFKSGSRGVGFHARSLDGDQLRWYVVRQRWLGR